MNKETLLGKHFQNKNYQVSFNHHLLWTANATEFKFKQEHFFHIKIA